MFGLFLINIQVCGFFWSNGNELVRADRGVYGLWFGLASLYIERKVEERKSYKQIIKKKMYFITLIWFQSLHTLNFADNASGFASQVIYRQVCFRLR